MLINNISQSENSTEILKPKMNEFENWKDQSFCWSWKWRAKSYTSWVITKKNKYQKLTNKARLVGCGFEELDRDIIRTDSPTCSKDNFGLD